MPIHDSSAARRKRVGSAIATHRLRSPLIAAGLAPRARLAEALSDLFGIEAKTWAAPSAKAARAELVGVVIDPAPPDAPPPRDLLGGEEPAPRSSRLAGAEVCVEGHTDLPSRGYHLIGTATTNVNGGWSYKLHHGPSRDIRIAYRFGSFQTSAELVLHTRARATLHLSRHRTKPHHRIYFSGEIAGPHCGRRVVVVRGTVPGAKRRFLVRRAKTDPLCHYHAAYAFSRPPAPTRFVFWAEVPEQSGYAYARGRSVVRYIRVRR